MNIYKQVCVPCIDEKFNRTVEPTCNVEALWRLYTQLTSPLELCPLGRQSHNCPCLFEQAVAAGMEKDDEGSGVGPQLLRLL